MKKRTSLIIAMLALNACTSGHKDITTYLLERGIPSPTKDTVYSCRAYGCQHIDAITIPEKDWKTIDRIFRPPSKSPEQERERIAKTIATFEKGIGKITGTEKDIGGTFKKTGIYQQDCVDESINTSIYLSTLAQRGLLKFHTIGSPTSRVPIVHAGRWPHQTAVIQEKETENFFAVDSWFHDNGLPPEIIPLKEWKAGWKPDIKDDKIEKVTTKD